MISYKLVPVEPTDDFVVLGGERIADHIRCEFLSNGFTAEEAQGIFENAYRTIVEEGPTVQGEPVGWQYYQDGKWWYGDDRIKDHRKNTEEAGFRVRDVYAAPQPLPCQECGGDGAGGEHEEDCAMAQPAEQQPASRLWSYCPECGSEHVQHHEGKHKQCANCHQEWFSGTDYTNVVRKHLAGKFRDKDAEIERLRSAESAKPAPDVDVLVEALESLIKGYVSLLEAGIDRITSLDGDCDSVPDMLRDARAALAAHRKVAE